MTLDLTSYKKIALELRELLRETRFTSKDNRDKASDTIAEVDEAIKKLIDNDNKSITGTNKAKMRIKAAFGRKRFIQEFVLSTLDETVAYTIEDAANFYEAIEQESREFYHATTKPNLPSGN